MALKLEDNKSENVFPLSYKNFLKVPGVYIITNILTGKQYVGESLNVWHRMYIHRNNERKQVISKAIRKYGIDNFKIYVEYFPYSTKGDLLLVEETLISKMECISPNGYNICKMGKEYPSRKGIPRPPRSKEWCENISKGLKGGKLSETTKQKMSLSRTGKKLSKETKDKISLKHRGKKLSVETVDKMKINNPNRKPVLQYDILGKFIAEHTSLYEAERSVGGNATNIASACSGKSKTSYGFIWKFKNSY